VLAAYWEALVLGAALDALAAGPAELAVSRGRAEQFLAAVRAATCATSPAVGLGRELHLDGGGVTGVGLEWDGTVPHLAAFAVAGAPADPGSGIAEQARSQPIRRRRR
jgi:hypothetical protein